MRHAVLPMRCPGEEDHGVTARAQHSSAQPLEEVFDAGEDQKRECDRLNVDRWNRSFLADTRQSNLDRIAEQSRSPSNTAELTQEAADALAVAGNQLDSKEYDPATQRLVHATFARYAEAAEACNQQRTGRLDALHTHHATRADTRTASWRAVDGALRDDACERPAGALPPHAVARLSGAPAPAMPEAVSAVHFIQGRRGLPTLL
jgi:hypothetical protein